MVKPETSLEDAQKAALLSMDSTLRSNLSVGMPIDLLIYRSDTLHVGEERRIEANDPYFAKLSRAWSDALRDGFSKLDEYGTDLDESWPVRRAAP